MNPDLNLKKSTTEEDALIMDAVKIHGTKWTEIAKMWVASGQSARTAALWPKYPHQRTAGLLVARPHHTVGLRSTRLCSRGQPPLCVEPDACFQSHSSSLSLPASLCMWSIGPCSTLVERRGPSPRFPHIGTERCRRLLPLFWPHRLSKLFQESLQQHYARTGARGEGKRKHS